MFYGTGVIMKDLGLLVWLTQLGLSVAVPLGGFVWLAVWLRNRFDWGVWVIVVGVLLGLFCAVDGFIKNMRALQQMTKKKKEEDR